VLYTGNSGTNAITGVGFQPDFVWAKSRTTAYPPELYDVIRGQNRIYSSATTADAIGSITSFDSDGFTHTSGSIGTNASGDSIVAWNWKAGGTAVSNTDGSITSSVSAAPDAGFSVISWTGTGADGTIGHGLTKTPEFFMTRNRDSVRNWEGFHKDLTTGYVIYLNLTNAQNNAASTYFQGGYSAATSSVISLSSWLNLSVGHRFIGYAFHSVDGFSKVGSYVGNGSADGPMVVTNFRPAFLLVKGAGNTYGWYIHDSTRDTFNHTDAELAANSSGAEYSAEGAGGGERSDFLSNGFKVRTSNVGWNQSGITYIYLAFAEAPFKYANAR
jgi:hypothetical protein